MRTHGAVGADFERVEGADEREALVHLHGKVGRASGENGGGGEVKVGPGRGWGWVGARTTEAEPMLLHCSSGISPMGVSGQSLMT